jgi:hypothetical protein
MSLPGEELGPMTAHLIEPWMSIVVGGTVLSVATIASGGAFLLRVLGGKQGANDLQKSFFRAGHAHAGVLVMLGLLLTALGAATGARTGWADGGAIAVLAAAILMPLGFFTSVLGTDPKRPNAMIASLWLGATSLVVGVIVSGAALIAAGVDRL